MLGLFLGRLREEQSVGLLWVRAVVVETGVGSLLLRRFKGEGAISDVKMGCERGLIAASSVGLLLWLL